MFFQEAGGFDFIGLISSLLGLAGGDTATLENAINDLGNNLAVTELFTYNYLAMASGFLSGLGETLGHLFKVIIDQVFKAVLGGMLKHLYSLFQKLQAWVKKLKGWLDRMRAIQQQYHVKAFRDFINMIQRIRRVLAIFRIFHFKFASKLDNWLGNIEGQIIRHEVAFTLKTNELVAWLNFLIDPKHGITHLPLWLGTGKSLNGMLGLLTGGGVKFWYSPKPDPNLTVPAPITYTQHYDALRADLATGGGDVQAWRDSFVQSLDLTKGPH